MGMNSLNKRKLFFRLWIILCMLLNAVTPQNVDDGLTTCEIEALVRQLTNPNPEFQMHAAALRNQLRNILESEALESLQGLGDAVENDYIDQEKRSLSSLARSGLLQPGKRYVGALARSGILRGSIDEDKRSLATLAKNRQFPSQEPDTEASTPQWDEKRNLGSLARSGYLAGKRNIGSLARDFQLPSNGKRNLASLARIGFVPSTTTKRNMASLARYNSYTNKREANNYWSPPADIEKTKIENHAANSAEKRNIGALKNSPVHGTRQKRDLYSGFDDNYEDPEQILQPTAFDYDDFKENMERIYGPYYGGNLHEGKRFLGSVARSGWFQSGPVSKRNIGSLARLGLLRSEYSNYGAQKARESYRQQEQKRHIGALARSGWLPSFRPVRSGRFSRSGRARSNITPNKSVYDNPSQPFVDDAMIHNYQIPLVGVHQDSNQPGVHHQDLQLYIGEVYDPQESTATKLTYNYDPEYPFIYKNDGIEDGSKSDDIVNIDNENDNDDDEKEKEGEKEGGYEGNDKEKNDDGRMNDDDNQQVNKEIKIEIEKELNCERRLKKLIKKFYDILGHSDSFNDNNKNFIKHNYYYNNNKNNNYSYDS